MLSEYKDSASGWICSSIVTLPFELHAQLIAYQSTAELARKCVKAARRAIWTQEDLDLARRFAEELSLDLGTSWLTSSSWEDYEE